MITGVTRAEFGVKTQTEMKTVLKKNFRQIEEKNEFLDEKNQKPVQPVLCAGARALDISKMLRALE